MKYFFNQYLKQLIYWDLFRVRLQPTESEEIVQNFIFLFEEVESI